jgi:hypothetical protein
MGIRSQFHCYNPVLDWFLLLQPFTQVSVLFRSLLLIEKQRCEKNNDGEMITVVSGVEWDHSQSPSSYGLAAI